MVFLKIPISQIKLKSILYTKLSFKTTLVVKKKSPCEDVISFFIVVGNIFGIRPKKVSKEKKEGNKDMFNNNMKKKNRNS